MVFDTDTQNSFYKFSIRALLFPYDQTPSKTFSVKAKQALTQQRYMRIYSLYTAHIGRWTQLENTTNSDYARGTVSKAVIQKAKQKQTTPPPNNHLDSLFQNGLCKWQRLWWTRPSERLFWSTYSKLQLNKKNKNQKTTTVYLICV